MDKLEAEILCCPDTAFMLIPAPEVPYLVQSRVPGYIASAIFLPLERDSMPTRCAVGFLLYSV